jgi:CDGSH-type Zn-finger protein/uncharacterized Fe-S cluster protein YjdI
MSDEKVVEYPGKNATVTWNGKLCIHMGECGRATGELFVGGRQPWCDPNLAGDEEVRDVMERCPTGALTARFEDGSYVEATPASNSVQVAYNGPLFLRGDLEIDGAPADAPGLKIRAALCRCGASRNKPFCDNSHEEAGFQDYGAVGEAGEASVSNGGTLKVVAATDGPLLLRGNLTIVASSGRPAWQGKQVALCRCGASRNKPFCDGEHKAIGFKSD